MGSRSGFDGMTTLSQTFRVLNELQVDGVIEQYAVAGAMAFLFYTEPATTYDLDVFVFLPPQTGLIFSMDPLYGELRKRGYSFDAEHVMIYETPVQFLPAYNALAVEAVEQAVVHDYNGTPVRVISSEHLIALAYQTGGGHRIARASSLLAMGTIDAGRLDAILSAHGIGERN